MEGKIKGNIDVRELLPILIAAGIDEVHYEHATTEWREPGSGSPVTRCALLKNGSEYLFAWTFLHPKDQFCRRKGRIAALRKAVRLLDIKNRRRDGLPV